jgi:hypothetical protein
MHTAHDDLVNVFGFTPARFTASRTTMAPSSVALKLFNAPRSFPPGAHGADDYCLFDF